MLRHAHRTDAAQGCAPRAWCWESRLHPQGPRELRSHTCCSRRDDGCHGHSSIRRSSRSSQSQSTRGRIRLRQPRPPCRAAARDSPGFRGVGRLTPTRFHGLPVRPLRVRNPCQLEGVGGERNRVLSLSDDPHEELQRAFDVSRDVYEYVNVGTEDSQAVLLQQPGLSSRMVPYGRLNAVTRERHLSFPRDGLGGALLVPRRLKMCAARSPRPPGYGNGFLPRAPHG